jgi:hypothetical protein
MSRKARYGELRGEAEGEDHLPPGSIEMTTAPGKTGPIG